MFEIKHSKANRLQTILENKANKKVQNIRIDICKYADANISR